MQGCAVRFIFCRKPTQSRHPHRHRLSKSAVGASCELAEPKSERRRMFECRQFDIEAYACPNRRHCYACDQHRRYRIGRLRFHVGRCNKYWLREKAVS